MVTLLQYVRLEKSLPGFNILPYGGGYSSSGPSNVVEIRRKHRWAFEVVGRGAGQFSQSELLLLQSASRPSLEFDVAEMHHNQEVASFAGKQKWKPIQLVWYDAEQAPDISRGIYHWIETVVNMHSIGVAHPRFYKRMAALLMLDGVGQTNERWTLLGTWPSNPNWGELAYTDNNLMTLEVSMIYDRAVRDCTPAVAPIPINPNCP